MGKSLKNIIFNLDAVGKLSTVEVPPLGPNRGDDPSTFEVTWRGINPLL